MLLLALCTLALGHIVVGESPLVTTSQGVMKGKVLKSRDGRDFFSFTRIPFAKPPLGERRFMAPEKGDNWTGILDATLPSPYCYGPVLITPGSTGQEDCLYLNVFTPNISGKYPVIFSIHGGAFSSGAADMMGRGTYFMDEDVVLVLPNYRLGNLGFLSLEDNVIPGNMGLKDQALALEWVHEEISAFGGDPNLITVIGESAGAASSHIICSAPRTNGLIKACVSQSGNGWSPWAILRRGAARNMALRMVKEIGCGGNTKLLKCLQSKPIEVVGNITLLQEASEHLTLVSPVLEPADAPGAVLTSWPPTSENSKYPWIIGVCQEEGLAYTLFYESGMKSKEDTEKFINTFNKTIITGLHLENRTDEFLRIWKRFFGNGVEPLIGIRNFITEYLFVHPTLKSLSRHSGPTYFFKFNYTGGPQMPFGAKLDIGVGHGADIPYFFERPFNQTEGWPKSADVAVSKMLVKMWVNFARDQIPSSQGLVQWPQFLGQDYLDIQNSGVTIGNYTKYQEILQFWNTILPDQPSKSTTSQSSLLLISLSVLAIITKALPL